MAQRKLNLKQLNKTYECDNYYDLIDYWYLCNHTDDTVIKAVSNMNKECKKDYMQYCLTNSKLDILKIIINTL